MTKKAFTIQYQMMIDGVQVIGIHRSDRGSKYRGRDFVVTKEGKTKAEFQRDVEEAVTRLLDGK